MRQRGEAVQGWVAALAVAGLALAGCSGDEAAVRPDGPVIKAIDVEGADKIDDGDIKKKILTSETPWYSFLPFMDKEYFDPNAWQADLRRIERYYEANGYYQAEVLEDQIIPDGDQVRLRVKVFEGEPTVIDSLEILGLDELPKEHRDTALEDLPLKQGDVFHEEAWAGLKGQIAAALKEQGYAGAVVDGEAAVDIATQKAHLTVKVVPGKRYKFGNIFVAAGARPKVQPKRIIEQVQGYKAVNPGEWYSEEALANSQARVFGMGVFGGVKVNRGALDPESATAPVVVDVREAPFHTIKLGGGLGVDLARNEVRAIAEYSDRNFLGDLRRLTTRAKVGYAVIPNALSLGDASAPKGIILDALAEIEQPRFFFRDLRAQASVGLERGLEPAYSFFGGRAKAGVIWQPHPQFSIFPSFNFEGYRLVGEVQLGNTATPLISGCPTPTADAPDVPCYLYLAYLEQVVEWDRRDDKLEPKDGYYVSVAFQEAGKLPIGLSSFSSFSYFRAVPDLRGYVSFFDKKLTLAGKVKLGTMLPFSGNDADTPIVTRFFSGGGASNRGFNSRRLSPRQYVPPPPATEKNPAPLADLIPIGGNGLVETSWEVRYSLTDSIILATFLDVGTVTRSNLNREALDRMQYAVGFGARYLTPVGPVRVDLAYRLPFGGPLELVPPIGATSPWLTNGGCFGLFAPKDATGYGGSPEGQCTFHLSIGEAF